MRLSDLARLLGARSVDSPTIDALDITEDSRQIRPGWIFAAIPGHDHDGNHFISDAVSAGAVAIISERSNSFPVPTLVVPDVRTALADAASALHANPSRKLLTFGVTGTDGKTTTCYFLRAILLAHGLSTGVITTVQSLVGGVTQPKPSRLTTPSAPEIQRTLGSMVAAGDEAAVVEASSHALVQNRLRGVILQAGAITNIAWDHIEYHGSRDNYARAKAKLFELIAPTNSAAIALNSDDDYTEMLIGIAQRPVITFGLQNPADVQGQDLRSTGAGLGFTLTYQGHKCEIVLPIAGRFNSYNALAAAALALSQNVPLPTIQAGLRGAEVPAGRMQEISEGQDFSVFVDYAHTEQAFLAITSFLSSMAHERQGRLISVFGAAGNRDKSKRPELASVASEFADFFIITNEDPFDENPSAIIAQIAGGAPLETRGEQWVAEPDRRKAIEMAFYWARPGDVVSITGKGHERSIAVGEKSLPWNDTDVAREILLQNCK